MSADCNIKLTKDKPGHFIDIDQTDQWTEKWRRLLKERSVLQTAQEEKPVQTWWKAFHNIEGFMPLRVVDVEGDCLRLIDGDLNLIVDPYSHSECFPTFEEAKNAKLGWLKDKFSEACDQVNSLAKRIARGRNEKSGDARVKINTRNPV